jgi:hypothetical protein
MFITLSYLTRTVPARRCIKRERDNRGFISTANITTAKVNCINNKTMKVCSLLITIAMQHVPQYFQMELAKEFQQVTSSQYSVCSCKI